MDAERFEIIKKLLEAHIKSLRDSIGFNEKKKQNIPQTKLLKEF